MIQLLKVELEVRYENVNQFKRGVFTEVALVTYPQCKQNTGKLSWPCGLGSKGMSNSIKILMMERKKEEKSPVSRVKPTLIGYMISNVNK